MEYTHAQMQYLGAIKRLENSNPTLKEISDETKVAVGTASSALKTLEKDGFVKHFENGRSNIYILTEKGYKVAEQLDREYYEFMFLFNKVYGVETDICRRQFDRVYGSFNEDFLQSLRKLRLDHYPAVNNFEEADYEDGRYILHFAVVQPADPRFPNMPSMGDRGFAKPAVFEVKGEEKNILLTSRSFTYMDKKDHSRLSGELKSLYILNDSLEWVGIVKQNGNIWSIPYNSLIPTIDGLGNFRYGTVRIKAVATVEKMPESIAEIRFAFEALKKL